MNGKSSDKNHKIISRTFILACFFFCNHISTNSYMFLNTFIMKILSFNDMWTEQIMKYAHMPQRR